MSKRNFSNILETCANCGGLIPQEHSEAHEASEGGCPGHLATDSCGDTTRTCGAFDADLRQTCTFRELLTNDAAQKRNPWLQTEEVVLTRQRVSITVVDDGQNMALVPTEDFEAYLDMEAGAAAGDWYSYFCSYASHDGRFEKAYERKTGLKPNWP
jgi:hypothetical protein